MSRAAQRATLRITADCNNHCIFCAQAGLGAEAPDDLGRALTELRRSTSELTFVGGEPTLWPGLVEAVRAAREAGFDAVGIQTNGARLGEPGFARALRDAGLTDVHVSLHGPEPTIHDYHTGVSGSFALLTAALVAAREAGLGLAATTVVTRSSFRSLSGMPRLLARHGVSAWLALLPLAAGRASAAFDRLMPRLGMAMPFTLHAISEARRIGLSSWVQGAPTCLLGPLTTYALPDEPRAFADACKTCAARSDCPGVDPAYLERFGGDELEPRDAGAPTEDHALARQFVGVGPKAPGAPPVRHGEPARSLPVLGRVQRAAKEVPRGAPQRTGEALREILPDLFEGAKGRES